MQRRLSTRNRKAFLAASADVADHDGRRRRRFASVWRPRHRRRELGPASVRPRRSSQPNCDKATEAHQGAVLRDRTVREALAKDGADNGGATAQGVTEDEIHVVVLVGDEAKDLAPANGGIKDYATGTNGTETNAINDSNAIYSKYFQTWGRTVVFDFQRATGTDEAAQRADALAALAKQPFAILCMACQVVRRGRRFGVRGVGGRRGVSRQPGARHAAGDGRPQPAVPRGVRCQVARRQAGEVRRRRRAEDRDAASSACSTTTARLARHRGLHRHVRRSSAARSPTSCSSPSPCRAIRQPLTNVAQQNAPTLAAKLMSEGVTTVVPFMSPDHGDGLA